jgi:hypothetical protein
MSPGPPVPETECRESDKWFLLVRASSRFVSFEAASTSAPAIRRRRFFVDGSSCRNAEIQALRAELRILPDGKAIPQYNSTVWPLTRITEALERDDPMVRHVLASCVEQFEAASLWLWYCDRQLAADIERRDRRRLGWIITKGPRERGSQGPLARGNLLRRPIVQPRMI